MLMILLLTINNKHLLVKKSVTLKVEGGRSGDRGNEFLIIYNSTVDVIWCSAVHCVVTVSGRRHILTDFRANSCTRFTCTIINRFTIITLSIHINQIHSLRLTLFRIRHNGLISVHQQQLVCRLNLTTT